jgi:hypothetical protein
MTRLRCNGSRRVQGRAGDARRPWLRDEGGVRQREVDTETVRVRLGSGSGGRHEVGVEVSSDGGMRWNDEEDNDDEVAEAPKSGREK